MEYGGRGMIGYTFLCRRAVGAAGVRAEPEPEGDQGGRRRLLRVPRQGQPALPRRHLEAQRESSPFKFVCPFAVTMLLF